MYTHIDTTFSIVVILFNNTQRWRKRNKLITHLINDFIVTSKKKNEGRNGRSTLTQYKLRSHENSLSSSKGDKKKIATTTRVEENDGEILKQRML